MSKKVATINVRLVPFDQFGPAITAAMAIKKCGGTETIVFCDRGAMNHWLALMRQRSDVIVRALPEPQGTAIAAGVSKGGV